MLAQAYRRSESWSWAISGLPGCRVSWTRQWRAI